MSKAIDIIREVNEETGDEYFPQTHVAAVIGVEDLVESYISTDVIVKSPSGKQFKLIVDDEGVLSTEALEGMNI